MDAIILYLIGLAFLPLIYMFRYRPLYLFMFVIMIGTTTFMFMNVMPSTTTNCQNVTEYLQPSAPTNSFGGAGSGQFGGFDGKLNHPQWTKTREDCQVQLVDYQSNVTDGIENQLAMMSNIVPLVGVIFAIIIFALMMAIISSSFYRYSDVI